MPWKRQHEDRRANEGRSRPAADGASRRGSMRGHDGSQMNRADPPRVTGIEPIDEGTAGLGGDREARAVPNQP